jgi:hypothetical protein
MDITNAFLKASKANLLWKINDFHLALEKLKNNGYEVSYWVDEENWATISKANIIGYLWTRYPLMMIEDKYADHVRQYLKDFQYVVYVETSSLQSEEYRIDFSRLQDIFDGPLQKRLLSFEDIWFFTNSI